MHRRDISKALFATATGSAVVARQADAQTCTAPCFAQTAAEIAAAAALSVPSVVVNYAYAPGDVRRYWSGSGDLTTALNNACLCNGRVYIIGGSYSLSGVINVQSNQVIYGDGEASVLTFSNNAANQFQANGISNFVIRDLKIVVTGSGVNTYIGAVSILNGASNGLVENLDISGVSGCGVILTQVTLCTIRGCHFHTFNNVNNDTGDVYLTSNATAGCSYCVIENNRCFGGAWHGISLETQGSGNQPNLYNVIQGNRIGQHQAYGINNYSGAANADNFTQIIGNYIENIQGNVITGNSGAGIYVVAAGAVVVANNIIRNCCVQTTSQTLAPAGIGINGITSGLTPISVTGNVISGMTRYNGIYVVSSVAGVSVTGNNVLMPGNNTNGNGINVSNSSNVTVTGNTVNSISAQAAILCYASSGNLTGLTVNSNIATHGGGGPGIQFTFNAPYTFSQCAVNGNSVSTGAGGINIQLANVTASSVAGNSCDTLGNASMWLATSTAIRLTGNTLQASGAYAFVTSGACSGSLFDESNYVASAGNGPGLNGINNAGTGCNVRQLGTAVPDVGTQILGDTVYNTAGVTPFAWSCTTAGSPGTFTGLTLP
jgi:hypothetical protein